MANRPARLEVGRIIKALQAQIALLRATPKEDPKLGEAYWEALQLEEQIKALQYRPTLDEVSGWGGNYLAIIRGWMQSNARNGSDVIWGSHEPLYVTSTMTPFNMEMLATRLAHAAINDHMGPYLVLKKGGSDAESPATS